jgi:hypothetical protein
MSRVGTEFDPLTRGTLGIVDVSVLYRKLSNIIGHVLEPDF